MFVLKVRANPNFQQINRRFKAAQEKMEKQKHETMRNLGRQWVDFARSEAPEGRTGRFRQSIFYRTFQRGKVIEMRTYVEQPLGTWIKRGTKPHVIMARNARVLRFLWENGPRSSSNFTAFHFYPRVNHPGTKENPYHERATRRWRPGAIVALRKIGKTFTTEFSD